MVANIKQKKACFISKKKEKKEKEIMTGPFFRRKTTVNTSQIFGVTIME